MSDGMVYEHILLAEEYLGRPLKQCEVVHHDDEVRSNNEKDNLYVFRSNSDHSRYHKTGVRFLCEDGSYTSPKSIGSCKNCGCDFHKRQSRNTYCSVNCHREGMRKSVKRKVERPSKQDLDILIHSKSFKAIGSEYGVSDNAVRKWCKGYGLPHRKKDLNL